MSRGAFDRLAREEAEDDDRRETLRMEREEAAAQDARMREHAWRLRGALKMLLRNPSEYSRAWAERTLREAEGRQ